MHHVGKHLSASIDYNTNCQKIPGSQNPASTCSEVATGSLKPMQDMQKPARFGQPAEQGKMKRNGRQTAALTASSQR
jgi:hypothetical protein